MRFHRYVFLTSLWKFPRIGWAPWCCEKLVHVGSFGSCEFVCFCVFVVFLCCFLFSSEVCFVFCLFSQPQQHPLFEHWHKSRLFGHPSNLAASGWLGLTWLLDVNRRHEIWGWRHNRTIHLIHQVERRQSVYSIYSIYHISVSFNHESCT